MGEVYDQFVRDLEGWRVQYRDNPRREIILLLMLALEREAIVATAYREQIVARRLHTMPVSEGVQELIRHALIWAWKDEEMHAIYIRGVIFKMGSLSLRVRAFLKQIAGETGGWAGSVKNHLRWSAAPLSNSLATLLTWVGIATGQVPEDVRKYLKYGTFREYSLFNVDAEKTAWLSYERLVELLSTQFDMSTQVVEDFRRIQDDEARHTRIFEILGAAVGENDQLVAGEDEDSLVQKIGAIGEVFLPRRHRITLTSGNPVGSAGPVWVMQGSNAGEKLSLFRHLLEESCLSTRLKERAQDIGKQAPALHVAIKTSFMFGYHHKDLSPITDPVLVGELASYLHEQGIQDIAVVEAPNLLDRFYRNRSVQDVARYFKLDSPLYRIVDACEEQVPYAYYRGLAQYSIAQTWQEADFRISFGKLRSHPVDQVDLSIGNLQGLGARCDDFIFSERQSHRDTAIMMLLSDFPTHFALLEGYDLAPDGILGMMGSPRPKSPHRFYAGADSLAVDMVAARHLGMSDPRDANMIRSACYWFGDPSPGIQVNGADEAIAGWRGPYHDEWSSLLSLMAYPVYQFGSGRGALFVPEMDEDAFPPIQRDGLLLRVGRKAIQAFLGLRHGKRRSVITR
ncbi:MAG TPA: DUF362 domain-containing protein [Aggregatilineales bacterium]|nr:DUF362 domain-containing protein [Aggregatilineales bacterium]